jgi:hypothetical protein
MMWRQGDLLFIKRVAVKKDLPQATTNVLAWGEVTGHKHSVEGNSVVVYDGENGSKWIAGPDGFVVSHDEHDPIRFGGGIYEMIRQREYSPEAIRMVAD